MGTENGREQYIPIDALELPFLTDDEDIRNVLLYCNAKYVRQIHAQMQEHFDDGATEYEVH